MSHVCNHEILRITAHARQPVCAQITKDSQCLRVHIDIFGVRYRYLLYDDFSAGYAKHCMYLIGKTLILHVCSI